MLRIRTAKTLFPLVAVAVMGSACHLGPNTKAGKFVVLNIAQCEPRLPKLDVTLPQHDPPIIVEVIMADGSKYVGVLQGGLCCGEGESWDKNGHYNGLWVGNVKCGKGIFKFSNGCTYEGKFVNDHPNGLGKMTLRNGKVFEGEFVNGVLQGQPRTLTFPWGRYEGDTLNNQPHGFGRMVHIDGALMVGEFCEGQAFGQGKLTDSDGNVVEGQFVNDKLYAGRVAMKDGLVLEGTFVDGKKPNGPGRLYHPGEGEFVGLFVNGMRHGPGHITFPDGSVQQGTYVDNQLHGMTRKIEPNGDIYEVEHIHGDPRPPSPVLPKQATS